MSERSAVQVPILKYAQEIGWEYVTPDRALQLCAPVVLRLSSTQPSRNQPANRVKVGIRQSTCGGVLHDDQEGVAVAGGQDIDFTRSLGEY